ncbi:MAG: protein disulfide isomerase family protein [Nanoarchaeota archaeon]
MKRTTALTVFILFLLVFPVVSASIFDWLQGSLLWITGRSVQEGATVTEQVICVFQYSDAAQKCHSDDGAFACSGVGSCTASISGEKDRQVLWKGSCSGESSTLIDGTDESITFACEQVQAEPLPPSPPPAVEEVKERVQCVFLNAVTPQECYTNDGRFSCRGSGSCEVQVYGGRGAALSWKSSCGGEFSTSLDGTDEELSFNCEQVQPAPTPVSTQPALEEVKERVQCVFLNAVSPQECFTNDGKFRCRGSNSCQAEVYGGKGNTLSWKSNCGGESSSFLDGKDEELKFGCGQVLPTTPQTPVSPSEPSPQPILQPAQPQPALSATDQTKEVVKCIFMESDSGQFCYSDDKRFGCKGISTCVVEFSGTPGERLNWRGSCEGSASTVVDGVTDYVSFKCAQAPLPQSTQPTPVLPTIKEKVKCLFVNAQTPQQCLNEYPSSGCKGIGSCTDENVVGEQGKKMVWKSSCGGGYAYTVMDGVDEYVEFTCPSPVEPPSTAQEQITCVFAHADSPQKCYSDDGQFGCSSTGEIFGKDARGVRYSMCQTDVSGPQGQKISWKSSCGNYGYTVIDGNPEEAAFQCLPSTEVSQEQISGKGFRRAHWECYDGTGAKTSPLYCKSSEAWQADAKAYCQDNCYSDESSGITKCGVNSFSVSEECYLEFGKEGTAFVLPPEHSFIEETPQEGFFVPNDGVLFFFYADACQHCQGMDRVLDGVGSKLGVAVGRIDITDLSRYGSLIAQAGVTAVPTIVYKRSDERFIKRVGKADAETIIAWLQGKEEAVEGTPPEPPQERKEEFLICKDSCPSDGKCFPFGYRKEGTFCSDEGAFVGQLGSEKDCENNFECTTNVCVDGKCMSSGLIQKIISWFRKIL